MFLAFNRLGRQPGDGANVEHLVSPLVMRSNVYQPWFVICEILSLKTEQLNEIVLKSNLKNKTWRAFQSSVELSCEENIEQFAVGVGIICTESFLFVQFIQV